MSKQARTPTTQSGQSEHVVTALQRERDEAVAAARRSEEWLRIFIDSSQDGITVKDESGRYVQVNQAACDMLGYSRDELLSMRISDLEVPAEVLSPLEQFERYRAAGQERGQFTFVRPDGRTRVLEYAAQRVPPDLHMSILRDVTERHLAEEAMRDSEQRFRLVFEQSPIGMALVGTDLKFVKVNRALCEMLGYSEQELARKTFVDITHPDDIDADVSLARRLFDGSISHYRLEKRYLTKRGEIIWINLTGTLIRNARAQAIYGLGMIENITERKRAEAALRAGEERLRSVFEASMDPLWDWEVGAERFAISPSWATMLGYAPHELESTMSCWERLLHPDDLPQVRAMLDACLAGRRMQHEAEYRMATKTGQWKWVVSRAKVVRRDETGRAVRLIGTISDITERKRTEDELRHRAELERLLFRELDHRVRNNLSSLMTLIDIAKRGSSDVGRFASTIRSRVEVMAAVHGLLSRSHWAPLKLSALIAAVTPGRHGGQLVLDGEDVLIPPRQVTALGMVIHELLVNSVKHGALKLDTGRVHLSWRHDDSAADPGRLRLSWRESGGPMIEVKPAPGSGTELIAGLVRTELQGEPEMTYPRQGAQHAFVIHIDPGVGAQEAQA